MHYACACMCVVHGPLPLGACVQRNSPVASKAVVLRVPPGAAWQPAVFSHRVPVLPVALCVFRCPHGKGNEGEVGVSVDRLSDLAAKCAVVS